MLISRFIPRHHDELNIEIGDPIYVQKEAEDLWCEGKSIFLSIHLFICTFIYILIYYFHLKKYDIKCHRKSEVLFMFRNSLFLITLFCLILIL